jgi:hypothetical protein
MARDRVGVRTFKNGYGETWVLRVDTRSRIGTLRGDDLGSLCVRIVDGRLPADLILAAEELAWIGQVWKELTGQELKRNAAMMLIDAIDEAMKADLQPPRPPSEPSAD